MLEPINPREKKVMTAVLKVYRSHKFLWDPSHALYYNKKARNQGLNNVLAVYKELHPDATLKILKKKLENMRNTFNKEFKKVDESISSEQDENKVYVPKLWYFELMRFLGNIKLAKTGRDTLEDTSDTEIINEPPSQQETWTPPIIEQPTPPPLKKLKQSPKDTAEELLGLATEYLNKPESEWEVMAKGWALKLSKLATDQRLFAEKIINDTLFEAQMGTLTRNGVRFLTASDSDSCRSSSKNEKFL
ncbi:uncharacterized protein [Halyomorpha halys]|uniref:uncharacterized protein isoform X3 n=1 Tax=Halyomorpha halys TaxID=286706 RepID=UPI0006D4F4AD|nr:uncharacterized protein LOC106677777 isoform X1 [Halyomorpha halys]